LFSILNDREFEKDYFRVRHCEFKDYDDFVKRYGSVGDFDSEKELELRGSFGQVLNTAELFGFLLKRKAVDGDFLYEVFPFLGLWEKVKPVVEGERKKYSVPAMFECFEYYYNEIKKKEQRGAKSV